LNFELNLKVWIEIDQGSPKTLFLLKYYLCRNFITTAEPVLSVYYYRIGDLVESGAYDFQFGQVIDFLMKISLLKGRDYFKIRLIERNCPNQYVKLQYWRRSVIFKRIINIVLN
jgi:hypothetical protein